MRRWPGFGGHASLAAAPSDPATACANLATLTNFPVTPTQITLAKFNPAGTTSANGVALPEHCQVQGIINKRIGIDGFPYGDGFEVRLPTPAQWNGRFMFQGGGGTEGSVPPAIGTAGTLSPTLAHGWAVASQDGGHENKDLPAPHQFFLDPQAVTDHAYGSIDVTAQTAKFLIDAYYGQAPDRSYFVGCSTGGRQGMVFSQNFPDYFDGIVAGDPVYDLEAIALTEVWGVKAIEAITPAPIQKLPDGSPVLYPALPVADQNLFTSAILAACDGLDGTVDGVVDNLPACWAKFDPATFVFPETGQPLQCTGAKTATCLSAAQIDAVKKINRGPRNSLGQPIKAPASMAARDHADNTVFGYPYDGGFMAATGIPSRKIGTPTSAPGDFALGLGQIPYIWMTPANPGFDPLRFDFDKDIANLNKSTPLVTYSASTDISKFKQRRGKIIWYHGVSDPGPPGARHHRVLQGTDGAERRPGEDPEVRPAVPGPQHGPLQGRAGDRSVRHADTPGRMGRTGRRTGQDHRVGHTFHLATDDAQPAALSLSAGSALRRCGRRRSRCREQLCLHGAEVRASSHARFVRGRNGANDGSCSNRFMKATAENSTMTNAVQDVRPFDEPVPAGVHDLGNYNFDDALV